MFVRNTKPPNVPLWFFFYLWPWRMTLTFHQSKCASPWDTHACQISSCYDQYCKSYDHFSKPKRKVWRNFRQTDGQCDHYMPTFRGIKTLYCDFKEYHFGVKTKPTYWVDPNWSHLWTDQVFPVAVWLSDGLCQKIQDLKLKCSFKKECTISQTIL